MFSMPWRSQIVMGITVNVIVASVLIARRYYPVLITKLRLRKLRKKEVKFVSFRKDNSEINRILVMACAVFVCIPYLFTALVIMSSGANKDE